MLLLCYILCLWACALSHSCYGMSPAAAERKTAVFKPYKGRYLPGSAIATYLVSSDIECSHRCSIHRRCRSFNYENKGTAGKRACELNSRSSDGHAQSQLVENPRMIFYENIFPQNQPSTPGKPNYNDDFDLKFPRKSPLDFVTIEGLLRWPLPRFTLCARVRTVDSVGILFSYAVKGEYEEIRLGYYKGKYRIRLHDVRSHSQTLSYADDSWHFACLSWDASACTLTLNHDASNLLLTWDPPGPPCNHTIERNGTIVLGQDQDEIGGGFEQYQSFKGTLSAVNIWSKVLTENEIRGLMSCSTG